MPRQCLNTLHVPDSSQSPGCSSESSGWGVPALEELMVHLVPEGRKPRADGEGNTATTRGRAVRKSLEGHLGTNRNAVGLG